MNFDSKYIKTTFELRRAGLRYLLHAQSGLPVDTDIERKFLRELVAEPEPKSNILADQSVLGKQQVVLGFSEAEKSPASLIYMWPSLQWPYNER